MVGFTLASSTSGPWGLASHSCTMRSSSALRIVCRLAAGRARDRRQVGVREAHPCDVVAHRLEVVDLGAVGRVVVDDDEQLELEPRRGLELLQGHERAAVPDRDDGGAPRPSDRGADPRAEAEADGLKAVHEHPRLGVGDVEVHRRVAHEVARVDDHRPVARQQRVEGDAQRAGVDELVGARVLVGVARPTGGPRSARRARACASRSWVRGRRERVRGLGGVGDEGHVGRPVARDRPGFGVDLDDRGVRADELAVAGRPLVGRCAREEDDVGLGEELLGVGAGEAARDAEGVGEAGEQPVGRGRGGQERARSSRPAARAPGRPRRARRRARR